LLSEAGCTEQQIAAIFRSIIMAQRMLMFAGKVHHLRHLGFCHLLRKDATVADSMLVNVHHDAMCRLVILLKKRSSTCLKCRPTRVGRVAFGNRVRSRQRRKHI
jgi:hypothetical protein